MSEGTTPSLPAAALDITALRRALDGATQLNDRQWTARCLALEILALVALVGATVFLIGRAPVRIVVAVGLIVLLVGLALILVVPVRISRRRSRAALDEAADALDAATAGLIAHLSSVGYTVPADVALDWISTPESTATVPLVHDSVIAARWWRPGSGDDRVFVEPFLRQDGRDSTLPVLPPL